MSSLFKVMPLLQADEKLKTRRLSRGLSFPKTLPELSPLKFPETFSMKKFEETAFLAFQIVLR